MTCKDNLGMCGGHPCGNGTCTNNCVSFSCTCFSGYNGNQCEFECGSGTFGQNCTQLCGQCKDGVGNCDHVTGVCSNGCAEGYIGNKCDFKCPEGICESNCTEICKGLTSTYNEQTDLCDGCCALCLGDSEGLEMNKNARLVEGCNLEVYGLLTALLVSLLIHCGFLTMYFLRLRRKRKDISTGTTPEYANVKSGKASTDHPNQEKTSTEINIYYEALHNNTSVQDAHNYASLVK
ncbi:scavenger receptor class F member 2-like [Saccostrea echinata]|uniref:scavenger receptor class F member 2-like n=1 Tax=Saccostrea echinata TaxID=191078 RepID=UPI002A82BAD8|nr:scavenger receptor class F member 2-like [Saccostrea echinata]